MIQLFLKDEGAAVTVDWVALTAAVILLSVLVFTSVRDGAEGLASNINEKLSKHEVTLATDK